MSGVGRHDEIIITRKLTNTEFSGSKVKDLSYCDRAVMDCRMNLKLGGNSLLRDILVVR